jgi:hypothetical protein
MFRRAHEPERVAAMRTRRAHWIGAGVLLATIAFGAAVRIETALSLPAFQAKRPEGMLKSDPALLYYVTERILASGGLPPDDFRADPRIEHPATSDIPAMFTVGQEFLVAWTHRLVGDGLPLHVSCVIAMGLFASLAALGVYGLALELTGRAPWAAFAALLYALTPANYRTIGFVLVREDFSLPFFALHLWLLARAVRLRTTPAILAAALALVAALATWHAMTFVATLAAGCVFAWFLRTGQNPLATPRSWWFPAALGAASLVVPVLRAKLFLLSVPMQVAVAMPVAAALAKRSPHPAAGRVGGGVAAALVAFTLALMATRWITGEGGDYGHVFEFVWSKLRFLGVRPEDPASLPFGARLLWQGPFGTGTPAHLLEMLAATGVLLPVAALTEVPRWVRGRGEAAVPLLMAFALASAVAALLIRRMEVVCGLVAPVAAVVLLSRLRPAPMAAWILGVALVQAAVFAGFVRDYSLDRWYDPVRTAALAGAIEWIRDELPHGGAIAADFVSSPAILAHTGHPVVLQPKYETRRSRDRIERFVNALYHRSPAGFRSVLIDDFDARYLLVDLPLLFDSRYQAGIPHAEARVPAASAAAALLNPALEVYGAVPGFRLLYRSPGDLSLIRIYDLEAPDRRPAP